MPHFSALLLPAILAISAMTSRASTWSSEVVGGELAVAVHLPKADAPPQGHTTAVVLRHVEGDGVNAPGQQAITESLTGDGVAVIEIDFARSSKATPAGLATDILKLRQDLTAKERRFLPEVKVNPARLFIFPAGYGLRQNIELARSDDRVIGGDVVYPVNANGSVPLLVEISCDNANRMGSGSLLFCRDTLMETATLHGFAAAMIDHPVRPPYKGIDDMPTNRETIRAAFGKLKEVGKDVGLSGKIGVMGFSRGAPMAAVVAADREVVQAALVHGNRFDYTRLRADDPMLKRFEKAWGPLDANRERWAMQGAMHYLDDRAAPMFLNTSDTESAEYRRGLQQLSERLTQLGVEHVYQVDTDGRGHRVTTDAKTLGQIMAFFRRHLAD